VINIEEKKTSTLGGITKKGRKMITDRREL
jgi:hypothetical protein